MKHRPVPGRAGYLPPVRLPCALLGCLLACAACEDQPNSVGPLQVEPVFFAQGVSAECNLASPLLGSDGDILLAAGRALRGLDPVTGTVRWEATLPAPVGEEAFVTGTPAIVPGGLAVVAYHTTRSGLASRDVTTARLRQRVAVIDLATHAAAADFAPIDLAASIAGNGGDVVFRADHQLARSMVVVGRGATDELGRAYVTTGNARDLQPWHGWVFEIDLDGWRRGAPQVRSLTTTPEADCGPEGQSGSRTRICGGGLWAPSGPLVRRVGTEDELVLAPGNGQLDLARGDYANTLMRVRRGLTFAPGCDAAACASSSTDPSFACASSCSDVFMPRTSDASVPLRPENGVCDGVDGLLDCWAKLDFVGGSTPIEVPLASGRRPLVYTPKDGHAYLVDGDHLGTLHDEVELVQVCGTRDDDCKMNWAGMIVTQPALLGGVVAVPTFMPDETHEAGVFGLAVDEAPAPRFRKVWRFPVGDEAKRRFRLHPSRPIGVTLPSGTGTFWLVETAAPGGRGRLVGLRAHDGALLVDQPLQGPGYRFTLPLYHDGVLYVPSCQSDRGPGGLEAYRVVGG